MVGAIVSDATIIFWTKTNATATMVSTPTHTIMECAKSIWSMKDDSDSMEYDYDDNVDNVVEDDGCAGNDDGLVGHDDAENDDSMEDEVNDAEIDNNFKDKGEVVMRR